MRADIRSWPTGRLLSVAARMVEGRFHDFLTAHGLTHAGLIALHHVVEGRLAQRELATLCRVTDQTMSRTVEGLHRAGYVERATDERDRRRALVEITPAGGRRCRRPRAARSAAPASRRGRSASTTTSASNRIRLITIVRGIRRPPGTTW